MPRMAVINCRSETRPFTVNERACVTTLIDYQSYRTGLQACVIEHAAGSFLNVDDLDQLTAHQYDDAIRFLVDFPDVG
jgi:hypothetical protein